MGLVLSRKMYETLTIGDDISVTVVRISKGVVRLDVNAPENVEVHRLEVYKQRQEERRGGDSCSGS